MRDLDSPESLYAVTALRFLALLCIHFGDAPQPAGPGHALRLGRVRAEPASRRSEPGPAQRRSRAVTVTGRLALPGVGGLWICG